MSNPLKRSTMLLIVLALLAWFGFAPTAQATPLPLMIDIDTAGNIWVPNETTTTYYDCVMSQLIPGSTDVILGTAATIEAGSTAYFTLGHVPVEGDTYSLECSGVVVGQTTYINSDLIIIYVASDGTPLDSTGYTSTYDSATGVTTYTADSTHVFILPDGNRVLSYTVPGTIVTPPIIVVITTLPVSNVTRVAGANNDVVTPGTGSGFTGVFGGWNNSVGVTIYTADSTHVFALPDGSMSKYYSETVYEKQVKGKVHIKK